MTKRGVTLSIDSQDEALLLKIAEEHGSDKLSVGLRKLCDFYRDYHQNRLHEQATRNANHDTILNGLNPTTPQRWPGINQTEQ